jgi:hypothetical protein
MTKKRVLLGTLALALVFGFVLAGCATSRIYDKKVPMKEQCVIMNAQHITTIDGNAIAGSGGMGMMTLVYPAGKHSVHIKRNERYTISQTSHVSGSTEYRSETYIPYTLEASVTFEFEPNKRYVLQHLYPMLRYNGRTLETQDEGFIITTRDGGVNIENTGLVIKEAGTRLFSTHIGLEFMPNYFMGWSYKDLVSVGGGPRLGLSFLHGYLGLKLLGEAGVGGILSVPDLDGLGIGGSVYYGGVADISFGKIGLEFGGGMIYGIQAIRLIGGGDDDELQDYSTPYLHTALLFPDENWGFYGQYYLNGEKWHNTFGVGIKSSW